MPRRKQLIDYRDPGSVEEVTFHDAARRRYLNYAISVITSRALPDVRDGLKPVQRRILYTMFNDLRLLPDRKTIKCAKVVGQVLSNYHPHGDTAVYDALVRMAQNWNLRYPLVFGQGNFGSLDGDSPAAFRYTEAKLEPLSVELLDEIRQETVDFRPNYDGSQKEPEVLPARVPHLLINGTSGIAVGMATNIPPHNLREVVDACVALIENRKMSTADLVKIIKGPDFPVGGEILNSRAELRKIYQSGQGSIRVRGEYEIEKSGRRMQRIIVRSIPYMVNKAQLVERFGELAASRKVPQIVDVRDESTDDIRIVLELKGDADADQVMAYLYRHTPLQTNFNVNLTCLVPHDGSDACVPRRADLKTVLDQFIKFRFEVVRRRFEHEMRLLKERCHILEGFKKVFDALDEAIRIVRRSEGKKDAAKKLRKRFRLDEVQADAVLELKLYKLAKLEIQAILDELREKRKRIKAIKAILDNPRRIWTPVKQELKEIGERYGDERRTTVTTKGQEEASFNEEAFIVNEDALVLLSRDGWVRRVQRVSDITKVRTRQGDEIIAVLGGDTRSTVGFFSNFGTVYTIRINDVPASPRGFGDPIQRLFRFKDGERPIAAVSFDPRATPDLGSAKDAEGEIPKNHAIAVSSSGYGLRFALHPYAEPSTRVGRRFARTKQGEEIVGVSIIQGEEVLVTASRNGRALLCKVEEVNFLSGPGRGVRVIKVDKTDRVLSFDVSTRPREGLVVIRDGGKRIPILPGNYRVTSRGGKGFEVVKRGSLEEIERRALSLPDFLSTGEGEPGGGAPAESAEGDEDEHEADDEAGKTKTAAKTAAKTDEGAEDVDDADGESAAGSADETKAARKTGAKTGKKTGKSGKKARKKARKKASEKAGKKKATGSGKSARKTVKKSGGNSARKTAKKPGSKRSSGRKTANAAKNGTARGKAARKRGRKKGN